ncbi:hypothetical protein C1645_828113 [Glomus cerebriforme]|uniref:Uncharacterized protein n=1 Tax=Glomus cerebriforme TaxID=658196 RepID=A0A397SWC5_9GLOM|nr:hypothetical protein C1645_828113 [Glomus cerebriforme]
MNSPLVHSRTVRSGFFVHPAQQVPISIYSNTSNTSENNAISNITNFNLEYITKIRDSKLYTPILQELNNNHIKYRHAYVKETLNDEELDVVNSIITVRKERPPGRVKNAVDFNI